MKKVIMLLTFAFVLTLSACTTGNDIVCGEGTIKVDGKCEVDTLVCEDGYTKEDGECVLDEVTCSAGYHEEGGECVVDEQSCEVGYHEDNGECVLDEVTCSAGYHEENGQCVLDPIGDLPDWFDGWAILTEPVGDIPLNLVNFTETGFSVNVPFNQRIGITKNQLNLQPGFYYEVKFDYVSDVAGKGIFVQLQGHGGNQFTSPNVIATETSQTFSQILPFPPSANGTTDGWLTIELTPSVAGTVTISNIQLIETALPTCGENEVISGIECIPANNGFLPNGTPTAWFDGWEILNGPIGNKDISDLHFTETGYTAYLSQGERTGIQLLGYVFESGYTYELSFDYTASEAGRMVWVQMEALGGYGFTNTDTWTINGTATFTQTLVIPSTYTPVEPGWIKLELTPGALDNVTIDNLVITKTPNE